MVREEITMSKVKQRPPAPPVYGDGSSNRLRGKGEK